ncbi:MAG: sulfatase [Planctomycetota bacterium]
MRRDAAPGTRTEQLLEPARPQTHRGRQFGHPDRLDQQRFDTIHALGNDCIFTPHLDWLVDQGISCTRAYADCPICIPARATIMCGRHGFSTGLTANTGRIQPLREHPTLPGILTAAGYQTRAVGKMHFRPERRHYGFEHMLLSADYHREMSRLPLHERPLRNGIGHNEMVPLIGSVADSRSQIDDHLGRLWGHLQHQRVLDDTWIICPSDHGDMLGDHRLGAKTLYQEGSAHIPFLIRPPQGVLESRRGRSCDELVSLADILPTLLTACGLGDRLPARIDGLDLAPQLAGATGRERIHGSCKDLHAIIEKRYKYIYATAGGHEQLFDLQEDPMEQHELIAAGRAQAQVERFRRLMHAHLRAQGHEAATDPGLRPGPEPDPEQLRRQAHPAFRVPAAVDDGVH